MSGSAPPDSARASDAEALLAKEEDKNAMDALKSFSGMGDRTKAMIGNMKNIEPGPAMQAIGCFLKYLAKPLIIIAGIYIYVGKFLYKVYKMLPMNVAQMVFGVGLCFFGGTYFLSIAAVEAFRQFGGLALLDELTIIWVEGTHIADASQKDDQVDANKDGTADVQQMSYNDLINHKAMVALEAVQDPMRMTKACQFLFTTWLTVLATLKFQFAKTVALCLAITEMLELPAVRLLGPVLAYAMGEKLNKWVGPIISTTMKIIAVVIATYVQAIISSFYSGLRGARLFAEGLINIFSEQGWMDKMADCCPSCMKKPFKPDESYLDEIIAYPLFAAGFYYQFKTGYVIESPYSIIMLPLTIVEYVLRWQVFTS